MKILPVLREKQRYLCFGLANQQNFSFAEEDLFSEIKKLLGEFLFAQAGPIFLFWDKKKSKGIIRCHHKFVNYLKASLILIKKINKEPVVFYSIRTSGSLKKVKPLI